MNNYLYFNDYFIAIIYLKEYDLLVHKVFHKCNTNETSRQG